MIITTNLSYELTAGEGDRLPAVLNTLATMHGIERVQELRATLVEMVWGSSTSDTTRVYQGSSGKRVQGNGDTTNTLVTIYAPR